MLQHFYIVFLFLLYMKFLQSIPIVGAVGGAYDFVYMKQINEYARIKYHKRFLCCQRLAKQDKIYTSCSFIRRLHQ